MFNPQTCSWSTFCVRWMYREMALHRFPDIPSPFLRMLKDARLKAPKDLIYDWGKANGNSRANL